MASLGFCQLGPTSHIKPSRTEVKVDIVYVSSGLICSETHIMPLFGKSFKLSKLKVTKSDRRRNHREARF